MKRASSKNTAPKVPDVVDVLTPADTEEIQLVTETGNAITTFVAGVRAFIARVRFLETRSMNTLMASKAIPAPHDAASDEVVQRFAKRLQAETKEVEDEWEITKVISAFHRRMTGRRKISTDALETATARVNKLHFDYKEAEKRRVAAEAEAERKRLEQIERDRVAAEAAKLEEQAVAAEAASATLSEREKLYVHLVAAGMQPQTALQRAGYKDPVAAGKKLINLEKITRAIDAALQAAALRKQAEAVKQQPLEVEVERVRPNITKGIAIDYTSHTFEIVDEPAFIAAFREGKYGIPDDCVKASAPGLNALAGTLLEKLNLIPGLRYVKKQGMR